MFDIVPSVAYCWSCLQLKASLYFILSDLSDPQPFQVYIVDCKLLVKLTLVTCKGCRADELGKFLIIPEV